ncbi:hypothetical protein GALMADRAFT_1340639 [Galerina marginata CBS 339.88]|uniref:Uncharacterized protein n=1 Tax=Galerina marginata (strain CBS 339.88) TaxID=685588 RepID=A0A067TM76_GALM3|nr:hypothetical protein GALMADRAFT_1340639 [Galerina marginata CBS 339.88]
MLFRPLTALSAGVLFSQAVFAALTPNDVVVNVNIVTSVSANLNSVLTGLTVSTSPQTVATIAKTTVTDFQTIITNLAGDVTAMEATPPFADGVTQPVVDALTDVHQLLLSTVIGKHGIFAQFGATAPIAAILSSLEAGIDSFAFAMIALIPTRNADVTGDQNSLDTSVGNTIALYQQICIPSLLFPALMPICVSL